MRLPVFVLLPLSLFTATPSAATPAAPPKLMIVISVDQLSGDLWDEYRSQFTGGLARLAQGSIYRNGYQSHATTETCPGHSTILTGDRPARTGIISNGWADFAASRADKSIYCAEDESQPGTDSEHYQVSAAHLKVPTLGDLLKRGSPGSRVVAVAGKDRAAVMMAGHSPDQLWYWGKSGFDSAMTAAPAPIAATANAAIAAEIAAAQPALVPPPFCSARARQVAIDGHAPVGAGNFARAAGDAKAFRASPEADGAVLALSAALVHDMGLGKSSSADLLAIGLSATDYVGHSYGTEGQEMCLQLLSLDRDLGDFFARLDSWGIEYAVALTADHGGLDIPERAKLKGMADAARIDPGLTPKAVGAAVSAKTGIAGPILADVGVIGDLYLDPAVKAKDRARALAAAATDYRAHPQVAAAFTRAEIAATPLPSGDPVKWSLIERVRASFDPARSGDLYVVLKPHVTPIGHATGSVATHGSPWDYDRRVPIIFYRPGQKGTASDEAIETVDIMPTLAALLGVDVASGSVDGKCLAVFANVRCPTN